MVPAIRRFGLFEGVEAPYNNRMELTVQSVTPFAKRKSKGRATFWPAVYPRR